jgi:hypothetical protein
MLFMIRDVLPQMGVEGTEKTIFSRSKERSQQAPFMTLEKGFEGGLAHSWSRL